MRLFHRDKPGPGIEKDAPPAKGLRLFGQILFREFFSMIKLSCLFLLFSTPIITIPAAYCAMTRITVNMVRDRPYFLWHDFCTAFRVEFGKATAAGLLLFTGTAVAMTAAWFYGGSISSNLVYCVPAGISVLTALLLNFIGFSLFPMIALMDLPLKHILKNALLLSFMFCTRHIFTLAVCLVILFLVLWFFPISLSLLLFICPALFNLITTFGAYGGIERYVITAGIGSEES